MSEHKIESTTKHKNVTCILKESGSEVELKLEQCEITYTTDLDFSKSSVTVSWDMPKIDMSLNLTPEGERAVKEVVVSFTNYLKAQEEGTEGNG